jgi:outer membrane protein assembly factor BamB
MLESGVVSYPLIADGLVFVTVENSQSYGTELYALDAKSGQKAWSVGIGGTYGFSALAYDTNQVFALNFGGTLTAFDATNGHENWSEQMPGQYSFTSPPTAYDGVVYVSGAGSGGTVYAVNEATGSVLWTQPVENGDHSSPAVDGKGVFVSYACQQNYRFSLSGLLRWHDSGACEGGGGSTVVIHNGQVYARGSLDTPVILSARSGAQLGSFASTTAPAFSASEMFTLEGGDVVAVDASGSPNLWSFGNGSLVTAPVVSNGVVYAGGSDGTVYGVSAATGEEVWSGKAGKSILGPDEHNADILVGLAIGENLLVVPAANKLTAFAD